MEKQVLEKFQEISAERQGNLYSIALYSDGNQYKIVVQKLKTLRIKGLSLPSIVEAIDRLTYIFGLEIDDYEAVVEQGTEPIFWVVTCRKV